MLPLDGIQTAARKALTPQPCGYNAATGQNTFLNHILAAINERRAFISANAPLAFYGADISEQDWLDAWAPATWENLAEITGYDLSDPALRNVRILDALRSLIVSPEEPSSLSSSCAVGVLHSCNLSNGDLLEGNTILKRTHVLAAEGYHLTHDALPGSLVPDDYYTSRYATDSGVHRGLFGLTGRNDSVTNDPEYGFYIGKNADGETVYDLTLEAGIERLNGAPLILTAQHVNELVMAVSLCRDLAVRFVSARWYTGYNDGTYTEPSKENMYSVYAGVQLEPGEYPATVVELSPGMLVIQVFALWAPFYPRPCSVSVSDTFIGDFSRLPSDAMTMCSDEVGYRLPTNDYEQTSEHIGDLNDITGLPNFDNGYVDYQEGFVDIVRRVGFVRCRPNYTYVDDNISMP